MNEKFLKQSYIAFAIRQGGIQHDRIKSLSVVDVVEGEVKEIYQYDTNPDNLSDVWVDVMGCFERQEYAVAYNLSTHRSNLEMSLKAVGVTPPSIKYLCMSNWANLVDPEATYPVYYGAESLVEIVPVICSIAGKTISDRYNEIHQNGRSSTATYFRQGFMQNVPDADLGDLPWLEEGVVCEDFWSGKTVVVTGDFTTYPDRGDLLNLVKSKGAKTSSDISGKTNIVLVGVGAGPSKLNKVRALTKAGKDVVCVNEQLLNEIMK